MAIVRVETIGSLYAARIRAGNVSSVYRITGSRESPRKARFPRTFTYRCTDSSLVYLVGFLTGRGRIGPRADTDYSPGRLGSSRYARHAVRYRSCAAPSRAAASWASSRSLATAEPITRAGHRKESGYSPHRGHRFTDFRGYAILDRRNAWKFHPRDTKLCSGFSDTCSIKIGSTFGTSGDGNLTLEMSNLTRCF